MGQEETRAGGGLLRRRVAAVLACDRKCGHASLTAMPNVRSRLYEHALQWKMLFGVRTWTLTTGLSTRRVVATLPAMLTSW
jgi:hypothetical protein